MRSIVLLIFFLCTAGCHKNLILINYTDSLESEINDTLEKLLESRFNLNQELDEVFALVNHCEYHTTITFSYSDNLSALAKKHIANSNRYLQVGEKRVPIVFYFDNGNSPTRINGVKYRVTGGMLIKFDGSGEILLKGPVE